MHIGVITQLLWPRYGPLWRRLIAGIGSEIRVAAVEAVRDWLSDPRLEGVAGLAFRLAAAEAIALSDCDLLLVPDLNPGADIGRGGGQDPWIASFPDVLAKVVGGLPPMVAVPAGRPDTIEKVVLETLIRLGRDPLQARRIWHRHRAAGLPDRADSLGWPVSSPGAVVVGLIGQPWLLSEAMAGALVAEGERLVSQHHFDPAGLRGEGRRVEVELVATDLEVMGAARLFGRRGAVSKIRMLVDREVGSDAWLARRVEGLVRKPVVLTHLQDLDDPVALLLEGARR